ncbi:MAG: NAD(P)/FAD-dependent oxidoreductase [Candidatus Krumholzibacteriia bacterium]
MLQTFDVVVIGTGTAGTILAHACRKEGLSVAVVDRRIYGGTCALRGCQPKKYLVAAAEVVARAQALHGLGLAGEPRVVWPDLMAHRAQFTDAIPGRTEENFRRRGVAMMHGSARFTGPTTLAITGADDLEVEAGHVAVATGAKPQPLPFPGAEHLITSDEFLHLPELPRRICFVGGGYISLEFAHVAARAGAEVRVIEMTDRILAPFDQDLVARLATASHEAGIELHLRRKVCEIRREGEDLIVCADDESGRREFAADLVVHGAGRVAEIEDLDLDAAGVEHSPRGIAVNDFMQSTSNPAVYAVGDAAAAPPMLAPVADHEAITAARNIVHGNRERMSHDDIPSVAFTFPALAAVGMTAAEATEQGDRIRVLQGETANWPSARRIGEIHGAYKVFQDSESGRVLGAHLLMHDAGELINLFALAIRHGLTGRQLKEISWAYPTTISNVKYMVAS